MAPSFGASIFLVSFFWRFIGNTRRQKIVFLTVLVSLAVGFHARITNDYRWEWTRQTRFFDQINWRMPGIEPQTSIFINKSISGFLNSYSALAALNTTLDIKGYPSNLPYWLENYFGSPVENNLKRYLNGKPINLDYRMYSFEIDRENTIAIYHDPEQCLKVLAPNDLNNFLVPKDYRILGETSNVSRIDPQGTNTDLPVVIFGKEQDVYWCYYYQKADLARQQGHWDEMIGYLDEAKAKGFESNNEGEYIQFVQAYGMLGEWENAMSLSQDLYEKDPDSTLAGLCFVWGEFKTQFPQDPAFTSAYETVNQLIGCQP